MSMKLRDMHEGKAYIANDWNVRLINKIFNGQIYYSSFTLNLTDGGDFADGRYNGPGDCQTAGFTNWADREVTADEFARLKIADMERIVEHADYHLKQANKGLNDYQVFKLALWRGIIEILGRDRDYLVHRN